MQCGASHTQCSAVQVAGYNCTHYVVRMNVPAMGFTSGLTTALPAANTSSTFSFKVSVYPGGKAKKKSEKEVVNIHKDNNSSIDVQICMCNMFECRCWRCEIVRHGRLQATLHK